MADIVTDLWDPKSFDPALIEHLHAHADLIALYVDENQVIDDEYDRNPRMPIRRENPHAPAYREFLAVTEDLMQSRTARVWHYGRLTDDEVHALLTDGLRLSTVESFRGRLDAQVAQGALTPEQAEKIVRSSPMTGDQRDLRESQFCTTAVPWPSSYDGVTDLLGFWGGEASAFWLSDDDPLRAHLSTIGRSRIVEVALPLAKVRLSSPGRAAISAFAHSQGIPLDRFMPDLFAKEPLGPEAVLSVHTEGEANYADVGRAYPPNRPGSYAELFDD